MKTLITWLWLFSVIGLVYKGYSFVWDKAESYVHMLTEKRLRAVEAQLMRKAHEERLSNLSDGEKQVVNFVATGTNCGVWVAKNSAAVLTLLYKGILKRISDEEKFEEWPFSGNPYDNRELCILVVLSGEQA